MAEAVSNSSTVCCFMTPEYEKSSSCKLELQHAQTCGKRIIPCMAIDRKKWKPSPSSWLGLLTNSIIAIDFSDPSEAIIQLKAKELIDRIKNQSPAPKAVTVPIPMELIEPIKQKYLRNSQIKRIVNEEKSFPIEQSYINLAIVETEEQVEKERKLAQQSHEKKAHHNDGALGTFEEIYGAKASIDVVDIFKKCEDSTRRMLVLGRAGIGKSTFCRYITYRWAKGEIWSEYELVVLIQLRSLISNRYPLGKRYLPVDLVAKEYFPCDDLSNEERQRFKEKCMKGQVLWILDGYDEFAQNTPEQLRDVFAHICETQHHILTSRPYAIFSPYDVKVEIIGFTDGNITNYVEQFFDQLKFQLKDASNEALECLEFLKSNPSIWGVAHVPVNLELICSVWGDQQLSETRTLTITALYDKMTEWLCRRNLMKRSIGCGQMTRKQVYERCDMELQFLEALAFKAMQCNKILLPPTLLEETLNETQYAGLDYLQVLNVGVLKSYDDKPTGNQNQIEKQHYFVHLSFQEFFAARHLLKTFQSSHDTRVVDFTKNNKYNQRFQLVFIFASGLLGLPEYSTCVNAFWTMIQGPPLDLVGLRHIKLIIECTDELSQYSDFPKRAEYIRQIANWIEISVMAAPAIIAEHLIQSLQRTVSLGDEPEIQNTLIALIRTQNRTHRRKTLNILSALSISEPRPEFLSEIFQALNDGDWGMRLSACRALEKIGEKAATREVIVSLINAIGDEDWYVRSGACRALWKIGEKAATRKVIAAVIQPLADEALDVGHGAYDALEAISEKAATSEVITGLTKALTGENSDACRRACGALGAIGEKAATSEVIAALTKTLTGENSDLRLDACRALGEISGKAVTSEVIAALIQALTNENSDVRQCACYALGKIGKNAPTSGVIAALAKALDDVESCVRQSACYALRDVGKKATTSELVAALIQALDDEDSDVKETAWNAIEDIAKKAATSEILATLNQALTKESYRARQNSHGVLREIGEKPTTSEMTASFIQALSDEDCFVSRGAYFALLDIGKKAGTSEAMVQLVSLLTRIKRHIGEDEAAQVFECVLGSHCWTVGADALMVSQLNSHVRQNSMIRLNSLAPDHLIRAYVETGIEMLLPLSWYVALIQCTAVVAVEHRIIVYGYRELVEVSANEHGSTRMLEESFKQERTILLRIGVDDTKIVAKPPPVATSEKFASRCDIS